MIISSLPDSLPFSTLSLFHLSVFRPVNGKIVRENYSHISTVLGIEVKAIPDLFTLPLPPSLSVSLSFSLSLSLSPPLILTYTHFHSFIPSSHLCVSASVSLLSAVSG